MEVSIDELKADTGLQTLLAKLEKAFAKEGADQAFEAYERFESLTRGSKSVVQHIVDFESAYSRIQKHKMTLPDSVLACKLLHSTGLDVKEKQLVLAATPKLEFTAMKSALKRIYASSTASSSNAPVVKEEPAFVASTDSDHVVQTEESALWAGKYCNNPSST